MRSSSGSLSARRSWEVSGSWSGTPQIPLAPRSGGGRWWHGGIPHRRWCRLSQLVGGRPQCWGDGWWHHHTGKIPGEGGDMVLGWLRRQPGFPRLAGRKGAGAPLTRGWLVFPPAGTVPLRLRRSPVFKRRTKHDSLPEPEGEPQLSSDAAGAPRCSLPLRPCRRGCWDYQRVPPQCSRQHSVTSLGATSQDRPRAGLEEPQAGAGIEGERPQAPAQTVANAQDSAAVDQRRPVPGRGEPALGQ